MFRTLSPSLIDSQSSEQQFSSTLMLHAYVEKKRARVRQMLPAHRLGQVEAYF